MTAIVAAILLGFALLLELAKAHLGHPFTPLIFVTAGLLFLALHQCGVGAGLRWGRRSE